MSTLMEVYQQLCTQDLIPLTQGKNPLQRRNDIKTALNYLAKSYDSTPDRLPLTPAIEANYNARLHDFLTAQGKGHSTVRNAIQGVGQYLRAYHRLLQTPPVPTIKRPDVHARAMRDEMTKESPYPHQAWLRASPYWLPLDQWPADLAKLFERYRQLKRHQMRETTFTKHLRHLEAYMGYLSMTQDDRLAKLPPAARAKLELKAYRRDRQEILTPPIVSSANDFFALASLDGFVTWHAWRAHPDKDAQVRDRPPSKPSSLGFALVGVLTSMAHHLKRREAKTLITYRGRLDRPAKTHDKKAPYHTFTVDELDQIGLAIIERARQYGKHSSGTKHPGARAAIRFQTGLMLLLGVRTPMRARQWAEALLGDNLRKVNGEWRWHFEGKQLKISKRGRENNVYDVPITDSAVIKLLEEYLEVWRLKLPGAEEDRHVFLGDRGLPLNHASLCARFKLHVYRYSGKRLFPHLLRTIFTSDAINRGVSRNLVALLLNDTPQTVDLRYNEVNPGLLEPSIPDAYQLLFPKRNGNGHATY